MWNENSNLAQAPKNSYPAGIEQAIDRDPRENGSLTAKLQVAQEMISSLRTRLNFLADRIYSEGSAAKGQSPIAETHMQLMRFPEEIIADARSMDSAINRIEGALGV